MYVRTTEFNVTDEIGSYLLYALNPDLAGQIRFWDQNPASRDNFLLVLGAAEAGLNRLLRRHGLTLPQLYRALAISCEEFIQGTNRVHKASLLCCYDEGGGIKIIVTTTNSLHC